MVRNGKSIGISYGTGKYLTLTANLPGTHRIAKCSEYKLNVLVICDLIKNYSDETFTNTL